VTSDSNGVVAKLWSYCDVLRDDGLSYQDYLEQLSMLLFLKMAEERAELTEEDQPIPEGYRWADLSAPANEGAKLEEHYRETLRVLGEQGGMLGLIFRKAENKIQDPAKLRRLIVDLIGKEQWSAMSTDVKGDAYESLLERNAEDKKSGAGQYFTPRVLIDQIIECVRPAPGEVVIDPACGTGGFLLAAHDYIANPERYELDRDQKQHLRLEAIRGVELVDGVSRLCAMNLLLHGIGPDDDLMDAPIETADALASEPNRQYPVVVTNPPFGKRSSITVVADDGRSSRNAISYSRPDFWVTTSNKQLNFLQHVRSLLETNGRAAVVVPDNVLFEGGAGETVRRELMKSCDLHTILRLPTGIFYAQGVKANVLFFEKKPGREEAWTDKVWFYDLRTNVHFTLKQNRMAESDLAEFVECYAPTQSGQPNRHERAAKWSEETPEGRWRAYSYEEIVARDKASLDIFWLRDESLEDSSKLPEPHVLAGEIADDLRASLEQIEDVLADLRERAGIEVE
jgi:type I restriction enzyme M protein